MDNSNHPSYEEAPARSLLFRAVGLFTGDMHLCREWVKRQVVVIQLLDWIFRGVAQVMFVNNPLSGLLITLGLFLQNPWWALNGLLGTLVSTVSAILLGQNRSDSISLSLFDFIIDEKKKHFPPARKPLLLFVSLIFPGAPFSLAFTLCYFHSCVFHLIVFCCHVDYICHTHLREAISAGLYGYNGTLVGILMAVFSAKASWYWWLLLPNVFMTMLCPVVSSALSSIASKWDVPIFTLPFNILVSLHIAATGANHPYFPEMDIQPNYHLYPSNDSIKSLNISQLFLSVPVGVGQVYGCDSPWTGGLVLLALLLSSPTICFHAMLGSAAGVLSGLALAAPHKDIYSGLWGYNSALSCIAIGGVFYVITWQTHFLALICALFCAYMTAAISKLMSVLALPACTWPFCLSTLIFLLISSEIPAICRLPLSVVSYPEENLRYKRKLKASEEAQHHQQSSSQEEAQLKEDGGPSVQLVVDRDCSESV
uniref:urea transporter 1-like isoform X1 n=1 Tax=Scatophagus argus TaxID=75038 RepID=UPI001ED7FE0E|nr:urea transporter 1-like isoform X1 [Scatophagus argus]XP_046231253.1 urea transporter 1-like isoform X1 [Scatophagus argus]